VALGALFGGTFFFWIAGARVIDPTEYAWLMKLDWRINFLGWHLFRNEPWQIPPGAIATYLAGEGTSIGFTDSVPIAALLLKPLDAVLPTPFQYFGLWLLLCFALQGLFGALIARAFTRNPALQLVGAAMFVLVPTLLIRVGHPALTAHFLLLWPLWLYLTSDASRPPSLAAQGGLGLCAGLTHPYLAAMALGLLASVALRDRTARAAVGCVSAAAATAGAWWMAGFVSVTSTTDLSAGGLGLYSMNVLGPISPLGWSTILPEQPIAHELQAYEGFQYFGAGFLLLLAVASAIAVWPIASRRSPRLPPALPPSRWWAVTSVGALFAVYALSPRITFGDSVIVDYSNPAIDRLAYFRASGRFFWPMTYLLLAASIGLVVNRTRATVAASILLAAVTLQLADQRGAHAERRATSRSEAFHTWPRQLLSPAWGAALPHYDRIVLAPPTQCGGAPIEHEELAFLAGLHGLSINSGFGARWDESSRRRYCAALEGDVSRGAIDERTFYVVGPRHEERLRAGAQVPVVCGQIDVARVCVTAASYRAWRQAAELSE
jgi:hypothetical protein